MTDQPRRLSGGIILTLHIVDAPCSRSLSVGVVTPGPASLPPSAASRVGSQSLVGGIQFGDGLVPDAAEGGLDCLIM
jgi:hypothetical protein